MFDNNSDTHVPEVILRNITLEGSSAIACLVSLDSFLIPKLGNREKISDMIRVVNIPSRDTSLMTMEDYHLLSEISDHSELLFFSEYRSSEILSHVLPGSTPLIVSGGFTIQGKDGLIDQEWRSLQSKHVKKDIERYKSVVRDLSKEIQNEAYMVSTLIQDGLPYGLLVPRRSHHYELICRFISSHPDMSRFRMVELPYGMKFRRKHISHKKAVKFLMSRSDTSGVEKILNLKRSSFEKKSFLSSGKRFLRRVKSLSEMKEIFT